MTELLRKATVSGRLRASGSGCAPCVTRTPRSDPPCSFEMPGIWPSTCTHPVRRIQGRVVHEEQSIPHDPSLGASRKMVRRWQEARLWTRGCLAYEHTLSGFLLKMALSINVTRCPWRTVSGYALSRQNPPFHLRPDTHWLLRVSENEMLRIAYDRWGQVVFQYRSSGCSGRRRRHAARNPFTASWRTTDVSYLRLLRVTHDASSVTLLLPFEVRGRVPFAPVI